MRVVQGNIVEATTDAIVNAANSSLAEGAGVCGAIFDAVRRHGGAESHQALTRMCRDLGGCPTGDAVTTPSFGLPARHIVHAVGPVWRGRRYSAGMTSLTDDEIASLELLASTYRAIFRECRAVGARSVTIPAISTGIYGLPKRFGHHVSVRACEIHAAELDVELIAWDEDAFRHMHDPVSPHVVELLAAVSI